MTVRDEINIKGMTTNFDLLRYNSTPVYITHGNDMIES